MEPKILLEDDELLVIDKPAGMVVNNAQSVQGETVQDWITRVLPRFFPQENPQGDPFLGVPLPASPTSDFAQRAGIVHRLDKETSGILVIAKTPEAFENLQKQFAERGVEKSYLALVHGQPSHSEGVISAPVGRLPWNRERFGVLAGGREATTKYRVLSIQYLGKEEFSLVELYPKTGRTHQIRVHLKSIGHAVVADEFYAGRKTARNDRKWCPRLFLHAKSISFMHPKTGERVNVESDLPQDLKDALAQLS
ncbi:RluA family pseudouridine synthase [Candidatus Microgenomates bacterium]|nr:RluA family pseudouridine synthase [Candidatus Microgenomates bacterium]